jgi:hypothetical protein
LSSRLLDHHRIRGGQTFTKLFIVRYSNYLDSFIAQLGYLVGEGGFVGFKLFDPLPECLRFVDQVRPVHFQLTQVPALSLPGGLGGSAVIEHPLNGF